MKTTSAANSRVCKMAMKRGGDMYQWSGRNQLLREGGIGGISHIVLSCHTDPTQ
jgi:hypothetical protein